MLLAQQLSIHSKRFLQRCTPTKKNWPLKTISIIYCFNCMPRQLKEVLIRKANLNCPHMIPEMIENCYPSNDSDDESADFPQAWDEEKTNGPSQGHSTRSAPPADLAKPQDSSYALWPLENWQSPISLPRKALRGPSLLPPLTLRYDFLALRVWRQTRTDLIPFNLA